jgi:hypothetical protein
MTAGLVVRVRVGAGGLGSSSLCWTRVLSVRGRHLLWRAVGAVRHLRAAGTSGDINVTAVKVSVSTGVIPSAAEPSPERFYLLVRIGLSALGLR